MTSKEYYDKYHENLSSQDNKTSGKALFDMFNELVREAQNKALQNCRRNEARGIPAEAACESYLQDAAVKFENINNMFNPPLFKKGTFNVLVEEAREQNK